MASFLYRASNGEDRPRWFRIAVRQEQDRWIATCKEVDRDGNEQVGGGEVAPAFYGLTMDQAHRRMLTALENGFSDVRADHMGAQ